MMTIGGSHAGLPRLLVDVRHEATHSTMPSLPLLQIAAESAFAWLRNMYWAHQEQHLLEQAATAKAMLRVSR